MASNPTGVDERLSVWLAYHPNSKQQFQVPALFLIKRPFLFIRSMKDTPGITQAQIPSMTLSVTEAISKDTVRAFSQIQTSRALTQLPLNP